MKNEYFEQLNEIFRGGTEAPPPYRPILNAGLSKALGCFTTLVLASSTAIAAPLPVLRTAVAAVAADTPVNREQRRALRYRRSIPLPNP